MLDIRRIRENPEEVKKALKTRNADYDKYIDEILEIDVERRRISTDTDVLKARQNKVSKEIPVMKKNGEDVSAILAEMNEIKEKIKAENAKISEEAHHEKGTGVSPNRRRQAGRGGGPDCSHCRQRPRYRRRGAGGPGRSHGQSPH